MYVLYIRFLHSLYHFSVRIELCFVLLAVPFICSEGIMATALGVCMKTPALISVSTLELITSSGALFGNLDATYHMKDDRVYIFDGKLDSVVNPGKLSSWSCHCNPVEEYHGHRK